MQNQSCPTVFGTKKTGAAHSLCAGSITPTKSCLSNSNCSSSRVFKLPLYGAELKRLAPVIISIVCSMTLIYPMFHKQMSSCFFSITRIWGYLIPKSYVRAHISIDAVPKSSVLLVCDIFDFSVN